MKPDKEVDEIIKNMAAYIENTKFENLYYKVKMLISSDDTIRSYFNEKEIF